jgi:hypothetical protein
MYKIVYIPPVLGLAKLSRGDQVEGHVLHLINCGYDHAIAVKLQNESIATLSDAISSLHLCSHLGFSKGGMVRLIFADGRTAHSRSTLTGPHGQPGFKRLWVFGRISIQKPKMSLGAYLARSSSVLVGVPNVLRMQTLEGISDVSGKPRDFYNLNLPIFIA